MNLSRLLFRLRRGWRASPQVIAFKVRQELQLAWLQRAGGWKRTEHRAARFWSEERTRRFFDRDQRVVFADDAARTLQDACRDGSIDRESLERMSARVRERDFTLLGAPVPRHGPWPWHADWRHDHTWEPAPFQTYEFYFRDRKLPCDVKHPWEVSRLGFLIPLVQHSVLTADPSDARYALDCIRDWETANPLAHSVAWFPMEASIRGINLVLLLEMIRAGELGKQIPADELAVLPRLLTIHGEFVQRTLEFSEVRGNHYAANIVFLAICGAVLKDWYAHAQNWLPRFAAAIEKEILLQFLPDGVNFEKSLAYHRLVAELFLVAGLVLRRMGRPLSDQAEHRLKQACLYTAACTRPDGMVPNVGDNDDARILQFDRTPIRDHSPLVQLGACYFPDGGIPNPQPLRASTVWLLGGEATRQRQRKQGAATRCYQYFPEGGVVTANSDGNFFWMDVGEVGLNGSGGHGHNDLLSFELCLQGRPLVVDPGSYVYTGDPQARNLFRGSRYHNGVVVDGEEIAPLGSMWQIGNDARPEKVEVHAESGVVCVRAAHAGYRRMRQPVEHLREVRFDTRAGTLECADTLTGQGEHVVERYLHLAAGINVSIAGNNVVTLKTTGHCWQLACDTDGCIECVPGWISPGYGVQVESKTIRIVNRFRNKAVLTMGVCSQSFNGKPKATVSAMDTLDGLAICPTLTPSPSACR